MPSIVVSIAFPLFNAPPPFKARQQPLLPFKPKMKQPVPIGVVQLWRTRNWPHACNPNITYSDFWRNYFFVCKVYVLAFSLLIYERHSCSLCCNLWTALLCLLVTSDQHRTLTHTKNSRIFLSKILYNFNIWKNKNIRS